MNSNKFPSKVAFKTSNEHIDLLLLFMWTDQAAIGKILCDIVNIIFFWNGENSRIRLLPLGRSVSEIDSRHPYSMYFRNNKDIVTMETLSKHLIEYFKLLHADMATHIDLGGSVQMA